jgi:hypothetical protein
MKNLSKNKSCIGDIALHGMAYYIFLKSLRSLEEFRKNPHVKIPPKSPCPNFQSLGKFKNPILIQKFLFFAFGPADLAAHSAFGLAGSAGLSSPVGQSPQAGPSRSVLGVFLGGKLTYVLFYATTELHQ